MKAAVALAVVVSSLLIAVSGCGGNGDGGRPTGDAATVPGAHAFFGRVVQYASEGNDPVIAEYLAPSVATRVPAVMLLHEPQTSREQWKSLAPVLVSAGYAVLAPDLDYSWDTGRLLKTVEGGLQYLKGQPEIEPERLAILGSDAGANLAYVSSGTLSGVQTTVALSADSRPANDTLVGVGYADFKPRSVFFISDEADSGDSTTLANHVEEPVRVKIFSGQAAHGGQKAHGVELLNSHDDAVAVILDWLAEQMKS